MLRVFFTILFFCFSIACSSYSQILPPELNLEPDKETIADSKVYLQEISEYQKSLAFLKATTYERFSSLTDNYRVQLSVEKEGVYFVSAESICVELGETLAETSMLFATNGIVFMCNGESVTYLPHVMNNSTGALFYASSINSPFANKNVYVLEKGEGVVWQEEISVSPTNSVEGQTFYDSNEFFYHETAWSFATDLMEYGTAFGKNDTLNGLNENFDLPGLVGTNASVNLQLFESMLYPHAMTCLFKVNGKNAHTASWNIICKPIDVEFSINNAMSSNNVLTTTPINYKKGYAFLKKLKVVYERFMNAENGFLTFSTMLVEQDVTTISGFSSTNLCVINIDDKSTPLIVRGRLYKEETSGYSVSFFSTNGSYVAFDYNSALIRTDAEVARELVPQVNLLQETNEFDYIMVIPNEGEVASGFVAALDRLADYRAESGFKVLQVTVQDIYNQFSYGINDVYAIKKFLNYANTNWTTSPKYVVLCGIGTFDYFNSVSGSIKPNLIPPLLAFSYIDGMRAADSAFVDFNNDLKPDIPIGRLPFFTAAKMEAYVQKVINYEKKGIWHTDVGFVASRDEGETSGNFPLQSDVVARYLPRQYMNAHYLHQIARGSMVSQAINFFNHGFAFVNYFGHGSYTKLSDSGSSTILHNDNVNRIYNFEQPSVFLQLTCDTGKFSHYSAMSIAEVLTGSTVGGTVLSFACTASSIDKWNYELGKIMLDQVFNNKTPRIGDLVVSSFEQLTGLEEHYKYIYETYTIFGDPALLIQYPTILADVIDGEGTVEPKRFDLVYGDYAVVTNTPAENYFIKSIIVDGQLCPPTNYVEFTSVTNNHNVQTIFEGNPTKFLVDSTYGSSNYEVGTNVAPYGSSLSCSITNAIVYSATDGIRYICRGWEGSGSVPSSGITSSIDFVLTNETHISWLWSTQVLFSATSSEDYTIIPEKRWYDIDETNAVIEAFPAPGYHFVYWTGDVPYDTASNNPVVLTMDRPKSLAAVVDFYSVTPISGENGSIYPASIQKYPTGATSEVFRIVANYGSHVDNVLIDGVSVGASINFVFENINSNHLIEALFETNLVDTFSINADHNNLGYVVGEGGAFSAGSTALFSNVSFEHTHVSDVIVDGFSVGITNQYVFENIISNHNYNVVFAMDTNSVSILNDHGYCSIPNGKTFFDYGTEISCNLNVTEFISPFNDGIKLINTGWNDGFGNINYVGEENFVNFTLTDDSGLSWTWSTQFWFEVSVNIADAGNLSEESGWNAEGEMLRITAIPNEHYEFVEWVGFDMEPAEQTNSYVEILMPAEPSHLEALFVLESFDIITSVSDPNAGEISPVEMSAFYGTNATFDILAKEHYYVADVLIDGVSVGATAEYTFENIVEPHEISVVFATNSYNVVIDSPYDLVLPSVGTNAFAYSNLVEIVVTNSLVYDQDILAKYSATGWVGSGSVPAFGSETNISFYIEEDSAISWLWHTNYYIEVGVMGSGLINATSAWLDVDSSLLVEATSTNKNFHFKGWVGDTNNCLINGQQITIPVDAPRVVNAWFKTNVFTVTSTSIGAGSITPKGDIEISYSQNSPLYYMQPDENAHIANLTIDGVLTNIAFEYIFMNVTNDHTITTTFATNSTGYHSLLVVPPTTNGRVYASSYYFSAGSDVTITNVADANYHVAEIFVNGTNVAPVDILELSDLQANQTVHVLFSIDTNKLEIIDSYGKSNYPEGVNWFDYNEYVTVSMTNDAVVFDGMTTQLFCYGWAGAGSVDNGAGTDTSFHLQTNSFVQWLWNTQYLFEATSARYGSVVATNGWYEADAVTSVKAVSDYGYHFVEWQGNIPENMKKNALIYPVISNTVSICATFDINHYPVSVNSGFGGTILPDGTNYVAHGSNITFNIIPDEHYHIGNVVVDGLSVGNGDNWTFNYVTNTHKLSAEFVIDEHFLGLDSLFGGETPLGTNLFDYGTVVNCYVTNSPIINGYTQYVCVGWSSAVGSLTTNGYGTNITFAIIDDTQLTWNWQTNYWAEFELGTGIGAIDMTSGWYKANTLLNPTATPANGQHLSYWSGDVYAWKQFLIMYNDTLNITNDYSRNLIANFAPDSTLKNCYIPGATNTISEFPAYLNSQVIYPLIDHYVSGESGICFATAVGDVLAYYDRNGYNGIPYWNLIKNGTAPLRQSQIYQSPGLNAANVASCVTNVGYGYYVLYPEYSVAEREIIEDYVLRQPGLDFDVVYHRTAEDDAAKEIFYNVIVDEINAGRPVILGWYGGTFRAHYIPAIGYVKDYDSIVNSTVYVAENRQNASRRMHVNFFGAGCESLLIDTIIPKGIPRDRYEELGDDSKMESTTVTIYPDDIYDFRQTHCFDETNDVDWIKCTLQYGREYFFDTKNLGPEVGTVLELYSGNGDLIERSPDSIATNGSTSHISYVAVSNQNVYLKLSPAEENMFGYNSNYDIKVTFSNMFATLEVFSEYGMTSLTNGVYEYPVGSIINCSITNQTLYSSTTNATKHTFKSWKFKNIDDTTTGTTPNCLLTLTKNSRLDWRWQTNHWVDIQAAEHGSFDAVDSWVKHGAYLFMKANAEPYYHFENWLGDVGSLTAEHNTIHGMVDTPLILSALFKADLEAGGTPKWWLALYGLTNDFAFQETNDFDGDGFTSGEEYIAGTDPTNVNSLFKLTNFFVSTDELNPYSVLNWTYTNNRFYAVEKQTNLLYDAVEITNNLSIGVYTDYYDSAYEFLYYKINVRLNE